MYHNEKIVLFISHIYGEYQKKLCQGIVETAALYGYQTEIYTTSDGENVGKYSIGENSILRIPNYEEISGVIIASDTYPVKEFKDEIIKSVRTHSDCPIIEVTDKESVYPTVNLNNNQPVADLTRHLIHEHGYRKIYYLGCASESAVSGKREKIFTDTLKECNWNFADDVIYQCDYDTESIQQALSHFTGDNKLPDALVCYNDRLALLTMVELTRLGYNIPHDIAIVGCDEIDEGQTLDPSLTTITFPVYQTGCKAVSQLVCILRGEQYEQNVTVLAQPVIGSSCGCVHPAKSIPLLFRHKLKKKIERLESSTFASMRMSADFSHVNNIDEGMDILKDYVHTIPGCSEFYLCLYSNWDAISKPLLELTGIEYEDNFVDDIMYMKLAVKGDARLPECTFAKNSLLPKYINSTATYVITPLYFENREFGYIVMAFDNNIIEYPFFLVQWFMNITSMLQSLCEAKSARLMQDKLMDIYLKDSLTGLYNRHGYDLKLEELLAHTQDNQRVTVFVIDMDYLKKINDEYGHSEGDFGIKFIGNTLSRFATYDMLCTRTGGDEFSVISNSITEAETNSFINKIRDYLEAFNALHSKPYKLSASIGYESFNYVKGQTNIEDHLKIADGKMYAAKRAKKAARE